MRRLESGKVMCHPAQILRPFAFGQGYAIGTVGHNRGQVVQRQPGIQRVDAHEQRRALARRVQHRRHGLSRRRFGRSRHRILQVEDQRIGIASARLGEFLLAVTGNEQERPHHPVSGRLSISAVRLH